MSKLIKHACLILSVLALSGCQCFRVCPDVPAPTVAVQAPALCYHTIRPSDPPNIILECYIKDIVRLEGYSKQLNAALKPYIK